MPLYPPEEPGHATKRGWDDNAYDPRQAHLWATFDDVWHAYSYGFERFRHPVTSSEFSEPAFRAWQEKVVQAQAAESRRDPGTRGVNIEDWTPEFWLYYYERMRAAPPPPYTTWANDD